MLPTYQRTHTDCFQCCIATLMNRPYDFVPDFMNMTAGQPTDLMAHEMKALDDWFAQRKLGLLRHILPFAEAFHALAFLGRTQPRGMKHILTGLTRKGSPHAWICQDGEMIFDPALPSLPPFAGFNDLYFVAYFIAEMR